ncbi:MAG: hypothetical protein EBY39_07915 [Flavobacteriia bacterium]|nr:hypothetical protein [Flavobacteriia bacterium]
MNLFQKKFFSIVNEQPELPAEEPIASADEEQAVADTMDDPAQAAELTIPDNPEIALKRQQSERTITTLTTWINEVENFIDYLNGTEEGSVNAQLNAADCDSILTDIQRSESKKISRLAQDLSSLGESLKQYLLLARRKDSGNDSI